LPVVDVGNDSQGERAAIRQRDGRGKSGLHATSKRFVTRVTLYEFITNAVTFSPISQPACQSRGPAGWPQSVMPA
ncbi:MAG TPA: hypothetical protein VHL09_16000, partial [Dehalococcoidia bacterium]|nr:hypothetical protein [Dehalococcoidia bacterium]